MISGSGKKVLLIAVAIIAVAGGCARHRTEAYRVTVPKATFEADLDACESFAAAARASNGAEGFLVGALLGAANGAAAGAYHGKSGTGAAVGASVGALIGLVQGLSWSDGASISSCMRAKGHRRA